MRSNGLATLLLMIPVLTVPALAIFGIPQFAPVVASPLDEGEGLDRETRVGNSARQGHDDFFNDVEGFGSEPPFNDDSPPKRRSSSALAGANRRENAKRTKDSSSSVWGDELAATAEWPSKQRRRASIKEPDELPREESWSDSTAPVERRGFQGSLAEDGSNRTRPRSKTNPKAADGVRLASKSDVDQGIVQASFEEQSDEDDLRSTNTSTGTRTNRSQSIKRKEKSSETLTWSAAVERLNQLEIRSFRLEPGHQLGQFVFICMYTPPDNPRVSHRFEAEADQPLKAVENVLEQIVEWQQRR